MYPAATFKHLKALVQHDISLFNKYALQTCSAKLTLLLLMIPDSRSVPETLQKLNAKFILTPFFTHTNNSNHKDV